MSKNNKRPTWQYVVGGIAVLALATAVSNALKPGEKREKFGEWTIVAQKNDSGTYGYSATHPTKGPIVEDGFARGWNTANDALLAAKERIADIERGFGGLFSPSPS